MYTFLQCQIQKRTKDLELFHESLQQLTCFTNVITISSSKKYILQEGNQDQLKMSLPKIHPLSPHLVTTTTKQKLRSTISGGFQLEFVSISQVINHMTCYKFDCSHWLKLQYSKASRYADFGSRKKPCSSKPHFVSWFIPMY